MRVSWQPDQARFQVRLFLVSKSIILGEDIGEYVEETEVFCVAAGGIGATGINLLIPQTLKS